MAKPAERSWSPGQSTGRHASANTAQAARSWRVIFAIVSSPSSRRRLEAGPISCATMRCRILCEKKDYPRFDCSARQLATVSPCWSPSAGYRWVAATSQVLQFPRQFYDVSRGAHPRQHTAMRLMRSVGPPLTRQPVPLCSSEGRMVWFAADGRWDDQNTVNTARMG